MTIRFIGDIHGDVELYDKIRHFTHAPTIQVGDLGIGFSEFKDRWDAKDRFIRGNHDNPELCRNHPNYIGDWKYEPGDGITDYFFISGAYSIDKQYRTPGITWWEEEELTYKQMLDVVDSYTKHKPKIVISHDCPSVALPNSTHHGEKTRTNQLLSNLFEIHRPYIWFHGHHHTSSRKEIFGTVFCCIGVGDWLDFIF